MKYISGRFAVETAAQDGEDGKDAVVITLVPEINSYNESDRPKSIIVRCLKTVGNSQPVECDEYHLAWYDIVENRPDTSNDVYTEVLPVYARKDNGVIPVRAYKDFKEADKWTDNYIAQTSISVVKDGEDGKDGKDGKDSTIPGPAGEQGPMYYPAGIWDRTKSYTRTKDQCPFVYYSIDDSETGLYYYPKEIGTIAANGLDPVSDGGNHWKESRNIEYIFTKFLMANFALLAGSVAYNNKQFSQHGTINGVASNDYKNPNFVPNLLLDWLNGDADITGRFSSNRNGNRIVINPESTNNDRMVAYNSVNQKVFSLTYQSQAVASDYYPSIRMHNVNNDKAGSALSHEGLICFSPNLLSITEMNSDGLFFRRVLANGEMRSIELSLSDGTSPVNISDFPSSGTRPGDIYVENGFLKVK